MKLYKFEISLVINNLVSIYLFGLVILRKKSFKSWRLSKKLNRYELCSLYCPSKFFIFVICFVMDFP